MTHRLIAATTAAGVIAVGAAAAQPKPDATATSSGTGGTAMVKSGVVGQPSRWRIVVTTAPAHLPVLVEFASQRRTGRSPMVFSYACARARCAVSVTGRLWPAGAQSPAARSRLATGSISVSIYRKDL